jgi:hypothetical protein
MESSQEHAGSVLEAMMVQESRYWLGAPKRNPYATSKQALPPGSSAFTRNATEPWRTQICQWYFQVSDCFDFDRGVVSVALNYLDRAVAQNCETLKFTTNRELQLLAVTALYLAMKLHGEIEPATSQAKGSKYERKKLTIDAFVVLSKRHFDVCAIETMELDLLSILKWQLNPIDARVFVACMLELMTERNTYLQEWRCIFDIARYIAELSLGEVDLVFSTRPSVVACASILCAINSLGRAGRSLPPMHVLQHMSTSIYEATSLSLDMEAVTQTAIRLTHLCPSIFVKEPSAPETPRKKRKSNSTIDEVSIDEIVDTQAQQLQNQRKTSPVCVGSFDDTSFFAKAGCRRRRR